MLDKLKDKAKGVQEKVSGAVSALQAKGAEELAKLSTSVEEIAPVLEALGYQVVGARITLGIPPSAAIGIAGLSAPVDAARFDEVLAQHADNLAVVAVLKALRHIVGVQSGVKIQGMSADMAEINLGTPPSVSLMFERRLGALRTGWNRE
jgi:hypothetical protein